MRIYTTDKYLFESHHNGLAYSLYNRDEISIVFVQGDDAQTLRDEFEALENANFSIDQILATLWEQYSPVATSGTSI